MRHLTILLSAIVILVGHSCVTCDNVRRYEMPNRHALRLDQYILPYDSASYSSCSALYFIDDRLIFVSDKKGYAVVPPSLFVYFSRFNTIK